MASHIDRILNSKQEETFYEILGVGQNASPEQIKTEYRIKAMACHPDKNDDPSSVALFQKLREAMETIGDPERRLDYDRWMRSGVAMPYEQWTSFKSAHKMSMHWATKVVEDPMIEYESEISGDPKVLKVNDLKSFWKAGDSTVSNSVLSKFRQYEI